jgi:hypothetical protein
MELVLLRCIRLMFNNVTKVVPFNFLVNEKVGFWQLFNFYCQLLHTLYFTTRLTCRVVFGVGVQYMIGAFAVAAVDACLTDDEPIWDPVEWSLLQSWIMFIFLFAWIAENLISSRYGSYTGRDKRIWFSWYKTFWLILLMYIVSYGAACLLVVVPFYHEITYSLPFVVSWWNWYSRVFFFKFVSLYSVALLLGLYLQLTVRTVNWERGFVLILVISTILSYLIYTHFIMSFFSYFTDPLWYRNNRLVDYVQLSHEPLKWGYGLAKRDHFYYHRTTTVFWFKNDGPFASAFLLIHLFLFFSLFSMYIYWITLVRKVVATQEISHTYTTYCVSALRQFMYFFFFIAGLVVISFLTAYWRFPLEFWWVVNPNPWFTHVVDILATYGDFIANLF